MNPMACRPLPVSTRHLRLATQPGVTPSQPPVSVSTTWPSVTLTRCHSAGVVVYRLNVGRHYPLRNEFGGIGVFKPADGDGLLFETSEQARAYAFERGYLQRFVNLAGHQRRVALARRHPGSGGIDSR